jgi:hypothetical protein
VKLIPKEYVDKGMKMITGKSSDDQGSDVDDLILITIGLIIVVVILVFGYFIARKLMPK